MIGRPVWEYLTTVRDAPGGALARRTGPVDIHARAREIRDEIADPAFMAELDQEAMAFQAECGRIGKTVAQVVEEIFRAADADEDPDRWTHAEAVAAWALGNQQGIA